MSGISDELYGIAHGGGKFVAVGENGTILTSSDGETWTTPRTGFLANFSGVAHGSGQFVAVAGSTIYTSSDGAAWTKQRKGSGIRAENYTNHRLNTVSYINNKFFALGDQGTILTSSNGTSWKTQTSGTSNPLYGITHGRGQFVVVGLGSVLTGK